VTVKNLQQNLTRTKAVLDMSSKAQRLIKAKKMVTPQIHNKKSQQLPPPKDLVGQSTFSSSQTSNKKAHTTTSNITTF